MPVQIKTLTRRVVDVPALYRDIGKRLRQARTRKRITQEAMALSLGMTRANVANLEGGKTRILLEHVYNVALVVGCNVRELLP